MRSSSTLTSFRGVASELVRHAGTQRRFLGGRPSRMQSATDMAFPERRDPTCNAAEFIAGNKRAERATLLIVDDQGINLHALHQVFKEDYNVLIATCGTQAIDICKTAQPDLILLDVVMPGMDGYAVCAHLKSQESTAHIPIIFVTANSSPQDEADCLTAGGVDFISKPVNPLVVRSRVRTHLTLKLQADRLRRNSLELTCAQRLGRVGSWSWQKSTDATVCSEQFCSMLGITPRAASFAWSDIKASFASASWYSLLKSIARAKKGHDSLDVALSHTRADGSPGWVLSNVEAVRADTGEVTAIRGTALDITDRKQIDQMRTAKEVAEMASEQKTRFLSSMSHELRTPLNAVLGFAQVLNMSPVVKGNQGVQQSVEHILEAGRHLLSMVDDILDLAGIESGKMVLPSERVNLCQVVSECVEMISMDALAKGLQVDVRLTDPPAWVQGNARRLRQILLNLLSNAIKYNRPYGDIVIEARSVDGFGHVSVTDYGVGLTAAQQAHLFQPFNRLGAENSNVPGSGIGLVVTQHLAKAMGGRIEFSSELGIGSTFTLVVPGAPVDDAYSG